MNPDELTQLINNRLENLPQSVHQAIDSIAMDKILQALSKKYNLHFDVWSDLEEEVVLTILDIHQPEDMAHHIAEKTHIDATTADALVNDIAHEIFLPIREVLQSQTERPTAPVQKHAPSDTLAYKAGESSTARKNINEDPYREKVE